MIDLSVRSTTPEILDGSVLAAAEHARCMADLARVNRLTLTHGPTLRFLARAARGRNSLSVLDVACGNGDLLRRIRRWADQRGLEASLAGIDLDPRSAEAATPPGSRIAFRAGDVFVEAPDPPPDVIVTSQFTHHLSDAQLVDFLRWIDRTATLGWFIADLHRHRIAYYAFPLIARAARLHRIVRLDGVTSISRSFRRADWQRALAAAGVAGKIRWHIPFRMCVSRLR
ncbi:MAG TPA: methyltransferase domain-containing protein [Acetobacteraceae bacterium]|jgi:SAM-dependent methyltransferase|nr:methyltransferase domain-containing protein [Acetobacteraceae bacterium]